MSDLPDPKTLESDELVNRIYAVQMCKMLRELLVIDPQAVHALITTRTVVNEKVVDSNLVKLLDIEGTPHLGVLGLVNGLLARVDGGAHEILAIFDGISHRVVDFSVRMRPNG